MENLKELRAFYSHINNNFYKKYRQNEELNDFFCAGEETLDNLKDLLTEEERQSFWNK